MQTEIVDGDGHRLYFQGTSVYLQLRGTGKARKLGEVQGDTFYTVRDLSRHEMHHYCEIGFNFSLIRYGLFNKIVIRCPDGLELQTTRRWVLKHGKVNRPGRRFELQIFLSVGSFTGFMDPPPDPPKAHRRAVVQGSLFKEAGP
jgi:hypothetical protein